MGKFTNRADYHYQTMRANIDLLSVIQLGITLFNEDGETPPAHAENGPYQNSSTPCPHTWQFNFKFSPDVDMFNQESIDFLVSTGMDLQMHAEQGIDPNQFGSALITSGLVMTDDIRWISFHSGYDFGYLVKIMHCKALPEDEVEYRRLLEIYFPAIYDTKFMVKSAQRFQTVNGDVPLSNAALNILQSLGNKGGLEHLAEELGVKRMGTPHTAGSDSLLTGKCFWEMRRIIFNGYIEDERYINQVWGLNGSNTLASLLSVANLDAQGEQMNLNGATMYSQNGQPTTPRTQHSGLANSSVQQGPASASGMGSLTPGGGGGVFGRFGFGK
jgi:CCR4-NOT transcription complex subunit 7/8